MKKCLIGCILCVLALATLRGETPFTWLNDLEEARTIAAEQQKPLLIVFRCEP